MKDNIKYGLKVLAVFLYAIINIITFAAVLNSNPGWFTSTVACVLLAVNCGIIYLAIKNIKSE